MVSPLNSIGAALSVPRYPVVSEAAAKPSAVRPGLVSVVRELNAVVSNLAHEMRVELDLGSGKLGARVVSDSGVIRPIPLEYMAQLATLLRQSGVEPSASGSQVDEIV